MFWKENWTLAQARLVL